MNTVQYILCHFSHFVLFYMGVYCDKIHRNQYNKHLDHRAISIVVDVVYRL